MKKELEKHGFTLHGNKKEGYEAQQYTPAGEDWWICFSSRESLIEYCQTYDRKEELKMWINAECQGKPDIDELFEDSHWKDKKLKDLLVELM